MRREPHQIAGLSGRSDNPEFPPVIIFDSPKAPSESIDRVNWIQKLLESIRWIIRDPVGAGFISRPPRYPVRLYKSLKTDLVIKSIEMGYSVNKNHGK